MLGEVLNYVPHIVGADEGFALFEVAVVNVVELAEDGGVVFKEFPSCRGSLQRAKICQSSCRS